MDFFSKLCISLHFCNQYKSEIFFSINLQRNSWCFILNSYKIGIFQFCIIRFLMLKVKLKINKNPQFFFFDQLLIIFIIWNRNHFPLKMLIVSCNSNCKKRVFLSKYQFTWKFLYKCIQSIYNCRFLTNDRLWFLLVLGFWKLVQIIFIFCKN